MPSSWRNHPQVHSEGLYKFVSMEVNLDKHSVRINRETYDILSWLGDIGGLIDSLYYLIFLLLKPFSKFSLSSLLLGSLFRVQPKGTHLHEGEVLVVDGGLGRHETENRNRLKKVKNYDQSTELMKKYESQRHKFVMEFKEKDKKAEKEYIYSQEIVKHLKRNFQNFKTIKPMRFVRYAAGTFLSKFSCTKRCSKMQHIDKF